MKKVLVTGATGRTGSLVFRKLQGLADDFQVRGFARSPEKVKENFDSTENFVMGDITNKAQVISAMAGCNGLVILTSAVPKMVAPPADGKPPQFAYDSEGMPELVDYQGQVNQIDAAREAGVDHIVLVGSMGGTNTEHPLNRMGNGNILVWKRQAEQYLIDSGINYTIIRAGGLLNAPGGVRELLVGKDDLFLLNPPDSNATSIPREDVAIVVVNALQESEARNKAFDLISKPEDAQDAVVTRDFASLFAQATSGL